MTARDLSRTTYTGLRELPWSYYLGAIVAMARLVFDLYESRLSAESGALCRRTLTMAETVAGGGVVGQPDSVRELADQWEQFAASDASEYDEDGLSAALAMFDMLAHELGDERAHYAGLNYVTAAVLRYPADEPIARDGPTLVRVDLTADRPSESLQGQILARFVRILREAEQDVAAGQRRTPAMLREATESWRD
jgi:hypothetical protein